MVIKFHSKSALLLEFFNIWLRFFSIVRFKLSNGSEYCCSLLLLLLFIFVNKGENFSKLTGLKAVLLEAIIGEEVKCLRGIE